MLLRTPLEEITALVSLQTLSWIWRPLGGGGSKKGWKGERGQKVRGEKERVGKHVETARPAVPPNFWTLATSLVQTMISPPTSSRETSQLDDVAERSYGCGRLQFLLWQVCRLVWISYHCACIAAAGDDAAFPALHSVPFPSSSAVAQQGDVADRDATMLQERASMLTTGYEDMPLPAIRDGQREPYNPSPAAASAAATAHVEVIRPLEYANFSGDFDFDLGLSWFGDFVWKSSAF